jgi:hypothetical protein
MRALVLGVATLALSASAALAQAPNRDVYPNSGYAPYGYGYVPSASLYNYAAPAYSGPAYGYSGPAYGYSRHHKRLQNWPAAAQAAAVLGCFDRRPGPGANLGLFLLSTLYRTARFLNLSHVVA